MARYTTISSISFRGVSGSGEDKLKRTHERIFARIDEAATQNPDIIVLPETFTRIGGGSGPSAEPPDGPTATAIAQKAREHGTYITCPILEKRDGKLQNVILFFDRKGNLAARYAKCFPTIGEMEDGVVPGAEGVVAATDLGKVGFLICFDLNFEELNQEYKKKGAELILFCSMFRGGFLLRTWAMRNRCYLASATPRENSAIVSPLGRILVESSDYERTITRTINLDCAVLHLDYNHRKFGEIRKNYGPEVEIEVASPEAIFLMTSNHPDRSVDEIIDEFELERLDDYFDRARRVRKEHLK